MPLKTDELTDYKNSWTAIRKDQNSLLKRVTKLNFGVVGFEDDDKRFWNLNEQNRAVMISQTHSQTPYRTIIMSHIRRIRSIETGWSHQIIGEL